MKIKQELIEEQYGFLLTHKELEEAERLMKIHIPQKYKDFLLEYGDTFLHESYYTEGDIYTCFNYICGNSPNNPRFLDLVKGNVIEHDEKYLPFGIDHGGWVFNVSLRDDDTFGQIWIDKFDGGDENPFFYVCDSLTMFFEKMKLM